MNPPKHQRTALFRPQTLQKAREPRMKNLRSTMGQDSTATPTRRPLTGPFYPVRRLSYREYRGTLLFLASSNASTRGKRMRNITGSRYLAESLHGYGITSVFRSQPRRTLGKKGVGVDEGAGFVTELPELGDEGVIVGVGHLGRRLASIPGAGSLRPCRDLKVRLLDNAHELDHAVDIFQAPGHGGLSVAHARASLPPEGRLLPDYQFVVPYAQSHLFRIRDGTSAVYTGDLSELVHALRHTLGARA
jgi:hypothetical protein